MMIELFAVSHGILPADMVGPPPHLPAAWPTAAKAGAMYLMADIAEVVEKLLLVDGLKPQRR